MNSLDLKIGAHVHTTDEPFGRLADLMVAPDTYQVTALLVEQGFLLKRRAMVPIACVSRATADHIYLDWHGAGLRFYLACYEATRGEPTPTHGSTRPPDPPSSARHSAELGLLSVHPDRQPIAPGQAVVTHSTRVETHQQVLGHVDHVLAESQTGQITHLVMRTDFCTGCLLVPMEKVQEVAREQILVTVARNGWAELPWYQPRTEADVVQDLYDRLHAVQPPAFAGVHASIRDGVVRLTGWVRSETLKRQAADAAHAIDGVLAVQNDLAVLQEAEPAAGIRRIAVTTHVSRALAADPRTARAPIEVIGDRGLVTLQGQVDSPETRQAAEAIARAQPGVTAVINELLMAAPTAMEAATRTTGSLLVPG